MWTLPSLIVQLPANIPELDGYTMCAWQFVDPEEGKTI